MKKIMLSLAMVSVTFAFAQKKEINAAFKAIEAGDVGAAKTQVSAAEAVIGANTSSVDPALLEKLYYAKGIALLKSGNIGEGASTLAKINGLKTSKFTPTLAGKIGGTISPIVQTSNKAAMDAYNAKNYAVAGPKFREVYDLLRAAGQDNKQYLYYSAITYALAEDKANAINAYNDLINSGYTGVETKYFAKNKKSGAVEELDKTSWDLMKKTANGDYTDFKTETSKSVEEELYETNASLMLDTGKYDDAIALAAKGLQKFPKNIKLGEVQGLAYYKSGKTDQFLASLKAQVEKNPQDKVSWYNLGVLASKDPSKTEEALRYFTKTVELDPNYGPAYQNMTYLLMDLDNDSKYIDQYNALRKAQKSAEANKIMEARRARFAKALPYAEKWYAAEPNNIDAVSLLKGLYQTTRNEAKFQEFKAKEAAMQKK
ncbi:tetratricopeptide repeat protein [Chryseobacterium taklimakanense]|uniref:Uncharacterized protein n=1 Tax=Chryseobacterium taklimakanense TaxID=536441 RepID=A0A3G8WLQ7_9FLAO|nr:hypothetical protein [Chryseobacterium taklimakanense]AZI20357.1 hypothetical protein EIH08_06190 [Chryseobacterium taklimakanense]